MTKYQLMGLLFYQGTHSVKLADLLGDPHPDLQRDVFLSAIQREDGSGSSFNVTIIFADNHEYQTFHIRTVD